MHHPFLRKYLLLAAIALAVLVADALIGHFQRKPGLESPSQQPAKSANSSPEEKPFRQVAALSAPATEVNLPVTAEQSAPVEAAPEAQMREKLTQQLQKIETDYKAIAQPIYDQSAPLISPDDRAKLAYLDHEKFEDLGKVLTTAELDVYQSKADESAAPQRR
ncbi:MAG: hypothetical protein QM715_14685 [Nibricoccus sp.]